MKLRIALITGCLGILAVTVAFWPSRPMPSEDSKVLAQRSLASTPPVATKRPPLALKKIPFNEIKEIEACYQSLACDFPQTDSRSYGIAIGRKLADKIAQLHQQYKKDSAAQKDLAELARHTMRIDDGFVQSAALDIFKELPIGPENLQAISDGVQYNTDPLISEKTLTELNRYMGTAEETKVQQVVQTMLQGAHFASQKVGENILSFINEQSFTSYQQIQQQMPAQSRVAKDLAMALNEYRKQRSGG